MNKAAFRGLFYFSSLNLALLRLASIRLLPLQIRLYGTTLRYFCSKLIELADWYYTMHHQLAKVLLFLSVADHQSASSKTV